MEERVDSRLVSLKAVDQVPLEARHAVGEDAHAVQQVADHHGLEDVELELAIHATDGSSNVVTHHLRANHGERFALGRVHLSRHDRGARLVLREGQLGQAATRAGSKVADILGDLEERASQRVQSTGSLDNRVVGSQNLELVGGGLKLGTGHLGNLGSNGLVEALEGVQTSADGSTTLGQVAEVGQRILSALNVTVKLGDIAGELLAKGKGSSILQMGTADFDELVELLHLGLESIAQALQGRDEDVLKVQDGSDMHDGREGVIRGGRHVDVVVGMDGLLGTHLSSQDLNGTVRDNFVGVHVGLGAGTSLPDNEREVVHELAVGNLLGSLPDGLAKLGVYNPLTSLSNHK